MTALLSTREVAAILRSSEDFVRDRAVELGAIRLGGSRGPLRFESDRVRAYIDRHRLDASTAHSPRPSRAVRTADGVDLLPLPTD